MVSLLTCEPGGVDIVRPLVIVSRTEEDSVTVGGQEVGTPVLALVADPQGGAVLGLAGVVRTDQLKHSDFNILFLKLQSSPPSASSVQCLQFHQEFSLRYRQHYYS